MYWSQLRITLCIDYFCCVEQAWFACVHATMTVCVSVCVCVITRTCLYLVFVCCVHIRIFWKIEVFSPRRKKCQELQIKHEMKIRHMITGLKQSNCVWGLGAEVLDGFVFICFIPFVSDSCMFFFAYAFWQRL